VSPVKVTPSIVTVPPCLTKTAPPSPAPAAAGRDVAAPARAETGRATSTDPTAAAAAETACAAADVPRAAAAAAAASEAAVAAAAIIIAAAAPAREIAPRASRAAGRAHRAAPAAARASADAAGGARIKAAVRVHASATAAAKAGGARDSPTCAAAGRVVFEDDVPQRDGRRAIHKDAAPEPRAASARTTSASTSAPALREAVGDGQVLDGDRAALGPEHAVEARAVDGQARRARPVDGDVPGDLRQVAGEGDGRVRRDAAEDDAVRAAGGVGVEDRLAQGARAAVGGGGDGEGSHGALPPEVRKTLP
jgi:hypothetical protein